MSDLLERLKSLRGVTLGVVLWPTEAQSIYHTLPSGKRIEITWDELIAAVKRGIPPVCNDEWDRIIREAYEETADE